MNHIYVRNLEIYAFHGVMPQENVVGNKFLVNIQLDCDLAEAMENDDIETSISYAEVIEIVKREMAITSKTLENVVYRIKNALIGSFPGILSGNVSVSKVTPPIPGTKLDEVAVAIEF